MLKLLKDRRKAFQSGWSFCFWLLPQSTSNKNKSMATKQQKKAKMHETKELLYSKGNNHQSEEVTCRTGKNICKLHM
jgi:hypothetical protein